REGRRRGRAERDAAHRVRLARVPSGIVSPGAHSMSLRLSEEEFEQLVVEELDALPDEMVEGLDNVVFVTEARPEDGSLDLLGIYEGVALTDRGQYGFGELPDRIVLFREPLLEICDDVEELKHPIHVTL